MTTHICFLFTWHVHCGTVSLGTHSRAAPGWWIWVVSGDERGELVNKELVFKIPIQWHKSLLPSIECPKLLTWSLLTCMCQGGFILFHGMCVCVCVCVHALRCSDSHVQHFATPWTVTHRATLSMGFPGKNTGMGWPFPAPGALPDPGIEPVSLAFPASAEGFLSPCHLGSPISWKHISNHMSMPAPCGWRSPVVLQGEQQLLWGIQPTTGKTKSAKQEKNTTWRTS